MEGFSLKAVLPQIKVNKKLLKRKEKREKKISEEEKTEFLRIHGKKSLKSCSKKSKKAPPVAGTKQKERRSKIIVANAETGRETFVKHKAKLLVRAKKANQKKLKKASKKGSSIVSKKIKQDQQGNSAFNFDISSQNDGDDDKDLLLRTIQGSSNGKDNPFGSDCIDSNFEMGNLDSRIIVSEDEVLEKANEYFKKLKKNEREINRAAALHLKKMREINRQGGDKEGFRYVLPKNTKELVRQTMEKKGMGSAILNNSSSAPSLFDSLNYVEDENDKPQRKKKKREGTCSDFYQSQVSKKWTRNAERFLFRDRVDKSLFESKKHQRSIKNL